MTGMIYWVRRHLYAEAARPGSPLAGISSAGSYNRRYKNNDPDQGWSEHAYPTGRDDGDPHTTTDDRLLGNAEDVWVPRRVFRAGEVVSDDRDWRTYAGSTISRVPETVEAMTLYDATTGYALEEWLDDRADVYGLRRFRDGHAVIFASSNHWNHGHLETWPPFGPNRTPPTVAEARRLYPAGWQPPDDPTGAARDDEEDEMKRGDSGGHVERLQDMLNEAADLYGIAADNPDFFGGLTRDGSFGLATENAVRGYQRYIGLSDTGVVDALTIALLVKKAARV